MSNEVNAAGAQTDRTAESQTRAKAPPGTVRMTRDALFVICGGATELHILSVKKEGGKLLDAMTFRSAVQLTEGERLGEA